MLFLFDTPWYRVVAIMALTWLAAAGPMPAFAPAVTSVAAPTLDGDRTMNPSAPDRIAPAMHAASVRELRAAVRRAYPEAKRSQG